MIRRPNRTPARLATLAVAPLVAVGFAAGLSACGGGSAAAPTDYARPTTTFTTEPVRTTEAPTSSSAPLAADSAADAAGDAGPQLPDGIVADPTTGRWTYELARGDNPSKLARRFGVTVDELAAANADTDGYGSYLVGTIIVVPNPAAAATTPTASATESVESVESAPPGETCPDGTPVTIHEIASGDNPSKLAERYGVTIDDLDAANAGTEGYSSYLLGTKVIIPC